jgi:hypothetical protein
MSQIPLRFGLLTAAFWLSTAAAAFAQEAPPADITLRLTPAQVAEVMRLVDLAAPRTFIARPPDAYWDLQNKINDALESNPDAKRAFLSAGSAAR